MGRRRSMLFASGMIEVTQMVVIKSSEIYTIPVDTVKLEVFIVGAGGGGGLPAASTSYGSYTAGYAGEGGAVVYQENMPFIKGEEINVVIGQGGSAATTTNNAGNKGGDTSFGTLIALGGNGGTAGTNSSPSIGSDGTACPFGDIESEAITSSDLFGANGGDGSTTTTANVGGNTGAGKGANRSTAAANAAFYGAGGGGGTIYRTFSTTIRNAGNGYQGVVILRIVRKMKESEIPLVEKFEILTDTTQESWTVPNGVKKIDLFIVGGGGSGCATNQANVNQKGTSGGNGGEVLTIKEIPVTEGQTFSLKIGGHTAYGTSYYGVDGNPTIFGDYIANGGDKGYLFTSGGRGPSNGKACPFGEVSAELTADKRFAAQGGFAQYTVSPSGAEINYYNGGNTGGGNATHTSTGGNASFYGSGGGAMAVETGALSYPGRGYQGIIIIRYQVKSL